VDEALLVLLILVHIRWQKLEGDMSIQFKFLGFIDDTHAAFAEFFEDSIMGYGFADYEPRSPLAPTTNIIFSPVFSKNMFSINHGSLDFKA